MKKDLQNLTQKILKEKIKPTQDKNKIQNWQNQIDDIENYQKKWDQLFEAKKN